MTGSGAGVPPTLLHNLRHNKVLHANVVLLTVITEEIPEVPDARRVEIEPLGSGFFRVTLRYGFVEEPDVPAAIALARGRGLPIDKDDITYFLGRETLLAAANDSGMARVARGAVLADVEKRDARDGVLPDSAGAGRGARDARGTVGTGWSG